MTRTRRWLLGGALVLGTGVLLVACGLRSEAFQVRVAREVLVAISDGIAGEITAGELDVDGNHVVARDLLITDDRGEEVIFAARAEVTFDVLTLMSGGVRVTEARAEGGRVHITERDDGTFGIDAAFAGTGEGGPSPSIAFDDIAVDDVLVHIEPAGELRVRVAGVGGHVSVHAGNTPTEVRFWGTHGRAHSNAPIPLEARVDEARGVFRDGARTRFDAHLRGHFMGDAMSAHLTLTPEGDGLRAHVETETSGLMSALAGLGIEAATSL